MFFILGATVAIFFERRKHGTVVKAEDDCGDDPLLVFINSDGRLVVDDHELTASDLRRIMRRMEFDRGQVTCDCCGTVGFPVAESPTDIKYHCLACDKDFVLRKELIADSAPTANG